MVKQEHLLCIDSSSVQASVALFSGGVLQDEKVSVLQRSHSEFVTVAIDEILRSKGLRLQDIGLIATSIGPGSFTGVRVSVGIAKTLAYALGVNVWAVDTLTVLRSTTNKLEPCFASINAYKNLVFASAFTENESLSKPEVLSFSAAAERVDKILDAKQRLHLVGDGSMLFKGLLRGAPTSIAETRPLASMVGNLHLKSPKCGKTLDWKSVIPLYLRGSEAEENLRIRSSESS